MVFNEKTFEAVNHIEKLRDCRVAVTGSTGLIGKSVIEYLLRLSERNNLNIKVLAIARTKNKAALTSFYNDVEWYYCDFNSSYDIDGKVDYIIHAASPTDSAYFISNPVETINLPIIGLNNLMAFAGQKKVKSMVFLSSMEVYGICLEDKFLSEADYYPLDCTKIRNSYAEGKKILENLCVAYSAEYAIPVKIARLCQTFGPGVSKEDNRVFSQFAKAILQHKDIILSTKGETKRSYCSLNDAVTGILTVLLNGENMNAYNIASDNSYCSIYELAEKFILGTNLAIKIENKSESKYLPTVKFGLDTTKIKRIGFKSIDTIDSIVNEFLAYYLHN